MHYSAALRQYIFPAGLTPYFRPANAPTPHFFNLNDDCNLSQILDVRHDWWMEIGAYSHINNSLNKIIMQTPDLAISLRSASVFKSFVAMDLHEHLMHFFDLPTTHDSAQLTCIQEALINALMHGNLEIGNANCSLSGLDEHYRKVGRMLTQTRYAEKRIDLMAWRKGSSFIIAVSDEGTGLSVESSESFSTQSNGRGLMLIKSLSKRVWVLPHNNQIMMEFQL